MAESVLQYLTQNWVELISAVLGLVYVLLNIKEIPWAWPVGIASVALAVIVSWDATLYWDMVLNVIYVVLSFYGWYQWLHGGRKNSELRVSRIQTRPLLFWLTLASLLTVLLGWLSDQYTDSDIPYWDAATTTFSLVATYFLARKYLQNWIMWILIDAVYVGVYYYKGLYAYMVLFGLYVVLAWVGWKEWKKSLPQNEAFV
jgi:nicotinamide mononucleotide transporter